MQDTELPPSSDPLPTPPRRVGSSRAAAPVRLSGPKPLAACKNCGHAVKGKHFEGCELSTEESGKPLASCKNCGHPDRGEHFEGCESTTK